MSAPAPTNGNSFAIRVRRLVLLERARDMLGGSERLAIVLGIGRRAVSHKLAAERGLSAGELLAVATALDVRARELVELAKDIRAVAA
jgi:DNA-binding transcriptional regulator YdaS (Cro superfamily)